MRGDALVAADVAQRLHQPLAREPGLLEQPARRTRVPGGGQQNVLDRSVLVLQFAGFVFRFGHQFGETCSHVHLIESDRWPGDFGQTLQFPFQPALKGLHVEASLAQNGWRQPALLLQQSQ